MKRNPWLNHLPAILVASCLAPVALTHAYPAAPIHTAQTVTEYNRFMRQGYTATANRDYQTALVSFRRALGIRPDDRYAINAVRNVSSYVARLQGDAIAFNAPNWGAPGSRIAGATRWGNCYSGNKSLTALVPATNVGTTTAEYPVLFFYVPPTNAQTLEFALLDETDNQIYQTTIALQRTPGIMSLSLADSQGLPPLNSSKKYHWYLSLVCNPQNRSADISVDGWVQRIEPEPMLASELNRATAKESVSLYAVNGIWYDTLAALARSRQSSPNNTVLTQEWADILKSVGLDKIAREPVVKCCTLRNSVAESRGIVELKDVLNQGIHQRGRGE